MTLASSFRLLLATLTAGSLTLFTAPASAATATTTFSTGEHKLVVPAGLSSLAVTAVGGKGGSAGHGSLGGFGAKVEWTMPVAPGEVYYLLVGGSGASNAVQEPHRLGISGGGGGGGGATDIRTTPGSAGLSPDTRLLVAAGGGGGARAQDGFAANGGDAGADGANGIPGGGFPLREAGSTGRRRPAARVARVAALRGHSGSEGSPGETRTPGRSGSRTAASTAAVAAGPAAGRGPGVTRWLPSPPTIEAAAVVVAATTGVAAAASKSRTPCAPAAEAAAGRTCRPRARPRASIRPDSR